MFAVVVRPLHGTQYEHRQRRIERVALDSPQELQKDVFVLDVAAFDAHGLHGAAQFKEFVRVGRRVVSREYVYAV